MSSAPECRPKGLLCYSVAFHLLFEHFAEYYVLGDDVSFTLTIDDLDPYLKGVFEDVE